MIHPFHQYHFGTVSALKCHPKMYYNNYKKLHRLYKSLNANFDLAIKAKTKPTPPLGSFSKTKIYQVDIVYRILNSSSCFNWVTCFMLLPGSLKLDFEQIELTT